MEYVEGEKYKTTQNHTVILGGFAFGLNGIIANDVVSDLYYRRGSGGQLPFQHGR